MRTLMSGRPDPELFDWVSAISYTRYIKGDRGAERYAEDRAKETDLRVAYLERSEP